MPVLIRALTESDFDDAEVILASAFQRAGGWRPDLRVLHLLQPDGLFLACHEGAPAGMVTAIRYPGCAYVGLMAVHGTQQHRGIGLALMEHLLTWLDGQGVASILLDASQAGQPLYERLGFRSLQQVHVYQRDAAPVPREPTAAVFPIGAADLDALTALDARTFGAPRRRLLNALSQAYPGRAFLSRDDAGGMSGFLFAQQNRLGPWVALDEGTAGHLLQAALALPFPGPFTVSVPAETPHAVRLLTSSGFSYARPNRHMVRGTLPAAPRREYLYSQASLSLG